MFQTVTLWTFLRWFAKYDDLLGDGLYQGDEGLNLPPPFAMIVLLGSSPSTDLQVFINGFQASIYSFHVICFVFLVELMLKI
jgi:hypothetical protein